MPQLHLNGEILQVQKYTCHLGHPIGNENINKIACNNAFRDIVWRTNYVMTKFGSVQLMLIHLCCAHIVLVSMDLHYGV